MLNSLIDICIAYILIVATMSVHNIAINHLTPDWLWTTENKWGKCLRQCLSHYIINTIIIVMLICYAVGSHQPNNLLGRISVNQDILSDNAGHSIELNGMTHVGPANFYAYINNHVTQELAQAPNTHVFIEGVRDEKESDQYHFTKKYINFLHHTNIAKLCAINTKIDTTATPLYTLTAQILGLSTQDDCFVYYAIRDGVPIYDVDAIITKTTPRQKPTSMSTHHKPTFPPPSNTHKTPVPPTKVSSPEDANTSINNVVQKISNKNYIPVNKWFMHHPYFLSIASFSARAFINIRTGADTIVDTIKFPLYHWHILAKPTDPTNVPDSKYVIHYRNTLLCDGMDKYPANHIIVVYGQAHIADIEQQWLTRHPNWHVTHHQYNVKQQPIQ